MKKISPHIIIEGKTQYCLGELKVNEIIYDFDMMLDVLQFPQSRISSEEITFLRDSNLL